MTAGIWVIAALGLLFLVMFVDPRDFIDRNKRD